MSGSVTSHATGKWKTSSVSGRTEMTIPDQPTDSELIQRLLAASTAAEKYRAMVALGRREDARQYAAEAVLDFRLYGEA